jgi:hypothetical protein
MAALRPMTDSEEECYLEEPPRHNPANHGQAWVVGEKLQGIISRGKSMHEQAQAVIVNAVERCLILQEQPAPQDLPEGTGPINEIIKAASGKQLLEELSNRLEFPGSCKYTRLCDRVVAGLVCMPPNTIRKTWRECQKSARPTPKKDRGRPAASSAKSENMSLPDMPQDVAARMETDKAKLMPQKAICSQLRRERERERERKIQRERKRQRDNKMQE